MSEKNYWTVEQDELVKQLRESTTQVEKDRIYNKLHPAFTQMIESIIMRYGNTLLNDNSIEELKSDIIEKILTRIFIHKKEIIYNKCYSYFSNISRNHLRTLYRIKALKNNSRYSMHNNTTYNVDVVNYRSNDYKEENEFDKEEELSKDQLIKILIAKKNKYMKKKNRTNKTYSRNINMLSYFIKYIELNNDYDYNELIEDMSIMFSLLDKYIREIFRDIYKISLFQLRSKREYIKKINTYVIEYNSEYSDF